ncbi:MAG: hypothetical protein AAF628_37060 [Planctomycetota bacterium]
MDKRNKLLWLALAPALALILIFGPLRPASSASSSQTAESTQQAPATPGTSVPSSPTLWQVLSTLAGTLILGFVGIAALAKLKGRGAAFGSGGPVALRQSVRLSARNAVHAVQFGDRVLLIGENDKGLAVLGEDAEGNAATDEQDIARRDDLPDDDDDGAVPPNLVIPRPAATRQRPPATRPKERATPTAAADQPLTANAMNEFKKLLELARAGARDQ